jgi:hydroxyethylthiazole kinase-like uncharacterized protein yjeF
MKYLPATAFQIQQLDHAAIEKLKIPSLKLMENAGGKSSRIISKELKPNQPVVIFCGKGNNGGDGFVVARRLLKKGVNTMVVLTADRADLKSDCRINYERYIKAGGGVIEAEDLRAFNKIKNKIQKAALIADALFGVGLKGELPEFYRQVIKFLNKSGRRIIAIDVPSGLDATSGKILGASIKADKTITFTLPKKGFFRNQGPYHCGEISVIDIGIPRRLLGRFRK